MKNLRRNMLVTVLLCLVASMHLAADDVESAERPPPVAGSSQPRADFAEEALAEHPFVDSEPPLFADDGPPVIHGPMDKTIVLTVEPTVSEAGDVTALRITVLNAGFDNTCLNLGTNLGNGRFLLPAISLRLTSPTGVPRDFYYSESRLGGGVGGRIDDYLVPLQIDSAYVFAFPPDRFKTRGPAAREVFPMKLEPGAYRLQAFLLSTKIQWSDPDEVPVDSILPITTGVARSRVITLGAARPAAKK